MQTNYSADDVAAATSLQFFTVRFFLVDPKAGNIKQSICISVPLQCVLREPYFYCPTNGVQFR